MPDYSSYVQSVPVGGSTGAVTSPLVAQVGRNGIPVGSPPTSPLTSTQSSVPSSGAVNAKAPTFSNLATDLFSGNYNPSNYTQTGAAAGGPGKSYIPTPGTQMPWSIPDGEYNPNFSPNIPTDYVPAGYMTYDQWQQQYQENQGGYKNNRGGAIHGYANGGQIRSAAKAGANIVHNGGIFPGDGAGRTDNIPVNVPVDSHVIPADVVSGLGEGNTNAGAAILDKMMTSIPKRPSPPPQAAQDPATALARGGKAQTKIIAASGEYLVPPDLVRALGNGDIALGHKVLDAFILKTRANTKKTLGKLKPPKK